jgi:hypothetical protein
MVKSYYFQVQPESRMSGSFAWVCICILEGGHFSFLDADADPGTTGLALRAALHLEARPISLEADCMKFQLFLGWRLASTTHYNQIIMGDNFPIL